jgi:hypothetical protein
MQGQRTKTHRHHTFKPPKQALAVNGTSSHYGKLRPPRNAPKNPCNAMQGCHADHTTNSGPESPSARPASKACKQGLSGRCQNTIYNSPQRHAACRPTPVVCPARAALLLVPSTGHQSSQEHLARVGRKVHKLPPCTHGPAQYSLLAIAPPHPTPKPTLTLQIDPTPPEQKACMPLLVHQAVYTSSRVPDGTNP